VVTWKGRALTTWHDLMADGIDACGTPEEAAAFMAAYRAELPSADETIGYLSGDYAPEDAARIRDWFGVEHPLFGRTVPTAREALTRTGPRIGHEAPIRGPGTRGGQEPPETGLLRHRGDAKEDYGS
jgi:hypothetical protein